MTCTIRGFSSIIQARKVAQDPAWAAASVDVYPIGQVPGTPATVFREHDSSIVADIDVAVVCYCWVVWHRVLQGQAACVTVTVSKAITDAIGRAGEYDYRMHAVSAAREALNAVLADS